MAKIIDGKAIAAASSDVLALKVKSLQEDYNIIPGLAVILVGDDPASQVYVRNKCKKCEELGFKSIFLQHPATETEENLIMAIQGLNNNPEVHGILVQLPLPAHINTKRVMQTINPVKDVDAFHPENIGKLVEGTWQYAPCTPQGILKMLRCEGIEIAGKEVVIVGRSDIVGKPLAMLMLHADATVTVCHSKTKNLSEVCKRADILIAVIGKPKFFTADFIKPGAVVIDVGINRLPDGKLCGDVDFEAVEPIASYITPVPGGCGPMTIIELMQNTFKAAVAKIEKEAL